MQCFISSKKNTVEYQHINSVTVEATTGTLQIKAGHAELFAILVVGTCTLEAGDGALTGIPIAGGVCHVLHDTVTILA